MKDTHTIEMVMRLHPKIRPLFTGFIEDAERELGIILRMVQGFRTFEEQDAIYAKGRTTPGENIRPGHPMGDTVTAARGGQSYHNYGLAGDVAPLTKFGTPDWKYNFSLLEPFSAKYGLTWGGHFPSPDEDHFENKFGYNWRKLLIKRRMGDFIEGTHYVNI